MEMKHRFGITPLQYRQGMETSAYQETPQTSD
jgi:AraC-like DNA-binding protein